MMQASWYELVQDRKLGWPTSRWLPTAARERGTALRAGLLLTRHPLQVAVGKPLVPIW
jgi:hypothetical protein